MSISITIASSRLFDNTEREGHVMLNLNLGQGKNGSISFVANEPGIFRYYCEYHEPTMSGQLVVLPKG